MQGNKFFVGRTGDMFGRSDATIEPGKTKLVGTQSHSPSEVSLGNGQVIEFLNRGATHIWLGRMLCTANTGNHTSDVAHHCQAALKAF